MLMLRRSTALLGLAVIGLTFLGVFTGRSTGQFVPAQPGGLPQPKQPSTGGGGSSSGFSSIKITEDSNFRRVINVGRDCIKDKEYGQAVTALQAVLNEKKDHYVQVYERDAAGRDLARWTSVKFEANNLLGSMPPEGLEVYEVAHGADAKAKLDQAKKNGDRELLAEVAQRFCHTKAGIEANEILATLFLARGQVFTSALRFEKILQMDPERTKLSDLTMFKAALAFRRSGDEKTSSEIFEKLKTKLQNNPLKVGNELIQIAKLESVLKEGGHIDPNSIHDWPMIRGNLANTAQANGSPPLLDTPLWRRPLMFDVPFDGIEEQDPDQLIKQRIDAAVKQVEDMNLPVLPGFFPIASQGMMVYRNHRGLVGVALKELDLKDEESGLVTKIKPGQIAWKTIPMNRSLGLLLEKNETRGKAEGWLDNYKTLPGFSSFLYDNTMLGTLATDHRLVYAINDLAVPPHPAMFTQFAFNNPAWNPQNLKPLLMQNELFAYDLVTGKLKWDLTAEDTQFKDSHFLSMPISVGGKLYVLNERLLNPNTTGGPNPFGGQPNPIGGESELRIVCIDPTKLIQVNSNTKPTILDPIQVLGNVEMHDRVVQDIPRRVNAVHLAYGEGVLVCPTNAGEVFGIDLMTRSLVWSYPYRESENLPIVLPGMPNVNPRIGGRGGMQGTTVISKWRSAPPAIQDGKIVFTAPDADSVHCISLRDGKPVWKRKQEEGDQFMAGVYHGRVLIVGKSVIRALDLRTGSQVWAVATGDFPSGQGVASKGIYYLPLKKGEILAVDIERGQVKAHNRAAIAGAAPGNLIFYEDMVLSQTTHEVMAYPQLSVRLEIAKRDSTKDPENMTKLTDYGELLLKDGQVNLAVESLLKVYHNKPADALGKRVKERLFEGLTDLMQTDFQTASKAHLAVYKELTSVPDSMPEEQTRKAKFFRLVGQGREAEGSLVEAFKMYKDFGALQIHRELGIPSTEDPNHKIPVNVWLRGRISGMLAKAQPNQKAPLEEKIAEEWKAVEAKKDEGEIRSFVGMFDVPFRVGREARVKLAESIMERNDKANFLEAEMLLHQVMAGEHRTDPKTGGPALAALALLEEKKGTIDSMRLAADYYRLLDRDFAKVPVRGGKTGADLKNELATDKRFLMFLEDAKSSWGAVKIAARELPAGAFNVGLQGFSMQPQGDDTPFARQNRLMLDPSDASNPRIRFRDLVNNQDRWATNLGHVPMNTQLFFHLYQQTNVNQAYQPNARFRFYHVKGHLLVCQVGVMVYCIDGDTGKKLWEHQTVDNIQNNGIVVLQQVLNDSEGNPEFVFRNQQTQQQFRVSLGRIGAAQASYVAVVGQKGLTVVDPLNGGILWKKKEVSMDSHVFGDEQYLFIADANAGGAVGVGRTLRAIDGEPMAVPDFSPAYQGRIRVMGRQILSAASGANYTLRLYDILAGKDVWNKNFPAGSFTLKSEDDEFTAVVDPKGALTVLESRSGKIVLESNVAQGRISAEDLRGLREPVLLHDQERFYIALNKQVEAAKIGGGLLHNNFNNSTRCQIVNGWFLAIHRADGQKKLGNRDIAWKKGDLAWHTDKPMLNQLLVLEQFEQSPIALFTARYNEILPNGGNRWVSVTQSLNKTNGKWIYDSGPKAINGASPMFFAYHMDMKGRTINLIGFSGTVQHYIDDGKGPPPVPQGGAMLTPGSAPGYGNPVPPQLVPPNGINPVVRPGVIIRRQLEIAPPIVVPDLPK